MTIFMLCAAIAAESYLLGSMMFGILISKNLYHDDIRTHGSGSAGMTNMLRTFGKKAAVMTAAGDALKSVAAVLIAAWLVGKTDFAANELAVLLFKYLAMAFAMLGHFKPVYFGFKGGKGVVTGAACLTVINSPLVFVSMLAVFLAAFLSTRMVSLGSVLAACSYPLFTLLYGLLLWHQPLHLLVPAVLIAAVLAGSVVYMHRSNIKRILNGTEYRFDGSHKKS